MAAATKQKSPIGDFTRREGIGEGRRGRLLADNNDWRKRK